MNIIAIETSCDETACAVVKDGIKKIAGVVASSKEFHEKTGGVVPEIAARKQVEFIVPVIKEVLSQFEQAGFNFPDDIDAIAVTSGPGLIGSLVVGVEAAKAMALAWNKPITPVNHLIGHIYANYVDSPEIPVLPALALVVSGGHTDLVLVRAHGNIEYLGGTLDDAAGEAFDKTARLLGLSRYLGGVQLSKLAATCQVNSAEHTLPRPMIDRSGYDCSFSGLKTAIKKLIDSGKYDSASLACEFENAVVDVLVAKVEKAITAHNVNDLLLGGGVAANTQLRTRMKLMADSYGIGFHCPSLELCGDSAVYIASAGYFNYSPKEINEINADPSLSIMSVFN